MSTSMESIEDDLQVKLDAFLDGVSAFATKQARTFIEEQLRATMVDYPHVDPKKIKALFKKLVAKSLKEDNMEFYNERWRKVLQLEE